jgi:phage tail tape-measure protein
VFSNESLTHEVIWLALCVTVYLGLRLNNRPPEAVIGLAPPSEKHYARNVGGGGFIAGALGGAYLGAGIGIVGGPFGAMAGTIPGALVGGVIGLFGGRKMGTLLEGSNPSRDGEAELTMRKRKAARVGGWSGLVAGATGGAWVGAGMGLAAGPLGAMAGTIPGMLVGGVIGYFGGESVGSHIPRAFPVEPTAAYIVASPVDVRERKSLKSRN